MGKYKFVGGKNGERITAYHGLHGPIQFVNLEDVATTHIEGIAVPKSFVDYGPSTPAPFGDIKGYVGDVDLIIRQGQWGAIARARHALEVRLGDDEYVVVTRTRVPAPTIERFDGTIVARLHNLLRWLDDEATPNEVALLALLYGSTLYETTLAQGWFLRD